MYLEPGVELIYKNPTDHMGIFYKQFIFVYVNVCIIRVYGSSKKGELHLRNDFFFFVDTTEAAHVRRETPHSAPKPSTSRWGTRYLRAAIPFAGCLSLSFLHGQLLCCLALSGYCFRYV